MAGASSGLGIEGGVWGKEGIKRQDRMEGNVEGGTVGQVRHG